MQFRKNNRVVSDYKLEKEDGTIVLNAPKEDWIAEGWEEYVDDIVVQPAGESSEIKRSSKDELQDEIQSAVLECRDYFDSIILKAEFNDTLFWLDPNQRAVNKSVWEDLLEAGIDKVKFQGKEVDTSKALEFMKTMNVFEYQASKVRDNHIQTIENFKSLKDLENYDFTAGYPDFLVLEASDKK